MFTLKQISIQDYTNKIDLYSKLVRNNLPFNIELHNLQQNTNLQIRILRDHDSIEKVIKAYGKIDIVTQQVSELNIAKSVIRLKINEEEFMIDTGIKCKIVITEYNVNKTFSDFPKGKAVILIDFFFDNEVETSKIRTEIKSKFTKETIQE